MTIRRRWGLSLLRGFVAAAALSCATSSQNSPIEVGSDPASLESARRRDVEAHPDDARAVASLGATLTELGRTEEAARLLSRAAGMAPRDPEIARWQGKALAQAGRPIEAFRAYARALDADPDYRTAYETTVLPDLLGRLGKLVTTNKRVVRDTATLTVGVPLSAAAASGEDGARLFEAVGAYRADAGSHNDAIEQMSLALATGHSSPALPFELARSRLALRQLDEAARVLSDWAEADSDGKAERLGKAAELLDSRFAFDLAEQFYGKALVLRPDDRGLMLSRGTVLLKAKRTADAEAVLRPLLSSGKDGRELLAVGQAALRFGVAGLAGDAFARAVALSPDDAGLWTIAVRALADAGRKADVEQVIGLTDHDLAWADAYLEIHEPKKASERYEAALAHPGTPPEARLRLARAFDQLGAKDRRDAAVADFLTRSSDKAKSQLAVAAFYESVAEPKRALAAYREAVVAAPGDAVAAFALARIAHELGDGGGERAALEKWAAQSAAGAARAAALVQIGEYWLKARRGAEAADALERAIGQGDTPSRRGALVMQAEVQRSLNRSAGRAEQLFRAWIDAAPEADKLAAQRDVADRIRGDVMLARFRNRLLEDLVQAAPTAEGYLELGNAYLSLRPPQREAGERAFARYVELSSDRAAAMAEVGERLEEANALSEAARVYSRLQPSDVGAPEKLLSIARVLLRTGDATKAKVWTDAYLAVVDSPTRAARDDLYRAASQMMNAGAWDGAVRILRALLPGEPNRARALKPLGDALLGQGDDAAADDIYQAFIDASGRSLQAVLTVGDAFRQRRFYARARTYYESVFDERSKARLARLFPTLFETYVKLGDKEQLRDLARRYVALTPNPRAYADAARRLADAGLLDDAFELYADAAKSQPNAAQYREQQASIALQLGHVDVAKEIITGLLEKDRAPAAWLRASGLFATRGRDDVASELLERAFALGVNGGALHLERGRIRLRAGDVAGAQQEFVTAIGFAPEIDLVVAGVRTALIGVAHYAECSDVLQRVAAQYPDRDETWLELGDAAFAAGSLDEARPYWARYADRSSRGALSVAGRLWLSGDAADARRYYERALESPTLENRLDVLSTLVSALLAVGLPERVPPTLERFASLGADGDVDRTKLAPLLEAAGFIAEATESFEALIAERPIAAAYLHLGALRLAAHDLAAADAAFERFLNMEPAQVDRLASADRGKMAVLHMERVAAVVDAYVARDQSQAALRLLAREAVTHADLAAVHLLRARLLLSAGELLPALEALGAMVEAPIDVGITEASISPLVEQIVLVGRSAEALEVLAKQPLDRRSRAVGLGLVRLALAAGDTSAIDDEIRAILSSPDGTQRYELGQRLMESGRAVEAADVWLGVLEPGQGLSAVDATLRGLLALARRGNDGLVAEVETRVGRLIEERQEQHRILGSAAFDVGLYDLAAEHAEAWATSLVSMPSPDTLLDPQVAHPFRLWMDSLQRAGRADHAFDVLDRYAHQVAESKLTYVRGAEFFEDRLDYAHATRAVDKGLALDTLDARLLMMRVRLALRGGNVAAARAAATTLVHDEATARSHATRLAEVFAAFGELEVAASLLDGATPKGPMLDWVRALSDAGRAADALAWAQKGVRSAPDPDFAAVRLCALGLARRGFPSSTLTAFYDLAASARPEAPHPVALLAKAVLALSAGDDARALESLEATLARGGVDLGAAIELGRRAGGPESGRLSALALFADRAIGAGRFGPAHTALERLAQAGGPTEGALAVADVVRKTFAAYPSLPEAQKKSLAEFALVGLEPLRGRGLLIVDLAAVISELHEGAGDAAAATFVYRDAIARFPGNPALRNNLAYLLARRGESLDEALDHVRLAMALAPSQALAYLDTEAWVLHGLSRDDEALALIQASLRHVDSGESPALAESYYHLGLIQRALGHGDEADLALRRAVRLDPDGPFGRDAHQALAK